MRQSILISSLIGLLIASQSALAIKCGHASGNVNVGQVRMGCMDIKGSANFSRSVITGPVTVVGPFNASEAKLLSSLQITGPVIVDKSIIYGPTNIVGLLQVDKSSFKDIITITTASLSFTDSTTEGIDVKSSQPVILELNNTTVNGDIRFINQNGIVKNNNSTITGRVIGGKVTTVSLLKQLKGKPGAIKVACTSYNAEAAREGSNVCDSLMIASL